MGVSIFECDKSLFRYVGQRNFCKGGRRKAPAAHCWGDGGSPSDTGRELAFLQNCIRLPGRTYRHHDFQSLWLCNDLVGQATYCFCVSQRL